MVEGFFHFVQRRWAQRRPATPPPTIAIRGCTAARATLAPPVAARTPAAPGLEHRAPAHEAVRCRRLERAFGAHRRDLVDGTPVAADSVAAACASRIIAANGECSERAMVVPPSSGSRTSRVTRTIRWPTALADAIARTSTVRSFRIGPSGAAIGSRPAYQQSPPWVATSHGPGGACAAPRPRGRA